MNTVRQYVTGKNNGIDIGLPIELQDVVEGQSYLFSDIGQLRGDFGKPYFTQIEKARFLWVDVLACKVVIYYIQDLSAYSDWDLFCRFRFNNI